ncbi:hypothetical protein [Pantoea ananatis]|uniref:hypothetical protein n=1 Tax=Pantoea ananas TaxID=553 RepID=UPI0021F72BD4|nr:hypothetical protein [Pantoea ananatis]MCW0329320.1 hypothetical protein [Pantoea ananatis]
MKYKFKFLSFTFLMLISLCFANIASAAIDLKSYNDIKKVSGVFENNDIVAKLKSLLTSNYDTFSGNFDVFGVPHLTRDGGLFVEGWPKDLYLEQASAFVIEPDGKVYAAWVQPDDNYINYVSDTSNEKSIQPDIEQWSKRFKELKFNTHTQTQIKEGSENYNETFETDKFKIKISFLCSSANPNCNDVEYTGVRKSDGAVMNLKGKAVRSECSKDVCPALSYKFKNHDTTYILNKPINNLTVIVNNKVVLSQDGKWSN